MSRRYPKDAGMKLGLGLWRNTAHLVRIRRGARCLNNWIWHHPHARLRLRVNIARQWRSA